MLRAGKCEKIIEWVSSHPPPLHSSAGLSLYFRFMKDHLFPCSFHVTSMAQCLFTMSVPCHSLGWPFKEKVARMDRDLAFHLSPSPSSFLPSFPIFFFLFFLLFPSFSSGFERFLGLVSLDLLSVFEADAVSLISGLDLLLDMTLFDYIEDRKTDI